MKKILIMLFAAAGVFVIPGCTKSYFDINDNPNSSTNATADLVLANALKTTADFQNVNYTNQSVWMGYWVASGGYAPSSTDQASYYENDLTGDATWTAYYRNLEDYDYIEKTATASNQYFYIAAAKTMKALDYSQLVDMFNNIPYSEALQGTNKLTPKYDAGQAIYEDLSTQLGTAVSLFQRADAVGSATQDVFFNGSNSRWIQFANTLRLRLLLRQTEMSGRSAYIQAEINKIVANGGGFLTADASVNPGYSNSTGKQNPFYGFAFSIAGAGTQNYDFYRANQYQITWGNANGDTLRYKKWYDPTAAGTYVGNVEGGVGNLGGNKVSSIGLGVLKSVSADAVVLSAAESYLLQAEASLRGFIGTSAQTSFNNGVQANFIFLGLTAAQATAYTSQNNKMTNYAVCTTFAERLACIVRQRYLANHSVTPFESWADYRRLKLPADVPITISTFATTYSIPFRYLYPRSEFQTNSANVLAQGTINHFTSKIFWMP